MRIARVAASVCAVAGRPIVDVDKGELVRAVGAVRYYVGEGGAAVNRRVRRHQRTETVKAGRIAVQEIGIVEPG